MPDTIPLLRYLKQRDAAYYGRLLELRCAVADWLTYLPATFPHYTRHTIPHSDAILRQCSSLLFTDSTTDSLVLPEMSATEAYILAASAYLHDAGMVVSESEKRELIASDEWNAWVQSGEDGGIRFQAIATLRDSNRPADEQLRHLIADVQLRHLIADFVRRFHHERTASLITEGTRHFSQYAFNDPALLRTIAEVCRAHGLSRGMLDDSRAFPTRRDIRGDKVNVRLLAILLRLGDLLDMSHDRACPLLLQAASPLPADSVAHWSSYQRIRHMMVAPDRIDLEAACETQDEHRNLYDWCSWLVDEVRDARSLMAGADRHADWAPPRVSLEGREPTILITPAEDASYIFTRWTFEVALDEVVERLMSDAYADPLVCVRELIQNAADASRCQMYHHLEVLGATLPVYPHRVPESVRSQYPIEVHITDTTIYNTLTECEERRQVITVEDHGIGMDEDVIQNYLLQIGRSFYETEAFRREYSFVPTSRFGIGFLACFALSDDVVVNTYRQTPATSGPIEVRMRGIRSYLLTEHGTRSAPGTEVRLTLQRAIAVDELIDAIRRWCRRLEFPVVLRRSGREDVRIVAELPEEFEGEAPDLSNERCVFRVVSLPIDADGLQGEFYNFVRTIDGVDEWGWYKWARYTYEPNYPNAFVPSPPAPLVCFHGINVFGSTHRGLGSGEGVASRVDLRGSEYDVTLARGDLPQSSRTEYMKALNAEWERIVMDHIEGNQGAAGSGGWRYLQQLIPLGGSQRFWRQIEGTVPLVCGGSVEPVSLSELLARDRLCVLWWRARAYDTPRRVRESEELAVGQGLAGTYMLASHFDALSDEHRRQVFAERGLAHVEEVDGGCYVTEWEDIERWPDLWRGGVFGGERFLAVDFGTTSMFSFAMHEIGMVDRALVVNEAHPLTAWLRRVCDAAAGGHDVVTDAQVKRLFGALRTPVGHRGYKLSVLQRFLERWAAMSNLGPDLTPPSVETAEGLFLG